MLGFCGLPALLDLCCCHTTYAHCHEYEHLPHPVNGCGFCHGQDGCCLCPETPDCNMQVTSGQQLRWCCCTRDVNWAPDASLSWQEHHIVPTANITISPAGPRPQTPDGWSFVGCIRFISSNNSFISKCIQTLRYHRWKYIEVNHYQLPQMDAWMVYRIQI